MELPRGGVLWRAGQAAPPSVGTEALPLRSLSGAGGASAQQHQVLPVSSQALARGGRHQRSGNSIDVEARAGPEGNQVIPGGEGQEGTAEEANVHVVTGGPQGQLEQDAWRARCQDAVGSGHALLFWIPEVRRTSEGGFDEGAHLEFGDISTDSLEKPSLLRVRIKASKTDQEKKGCTLVVGSTGGVACPVAAVLSFMAAKWSQRGPLFRYQTGRPLVRTSIVAEVRAALERAGWDSSGYSGHSFRIGAATTATQEGIGDDAWGGGAAETIEATYIHPGNTWQGSRE